MPENMSSEERKHWNLAVANNNTFRRFILKYGDKTLKEISNSKKGVSSINVFRGPDKDRYILDPKDYNLVAIDIGHFFAAAQVPLGLGNEAGLLVEINQLRNRQESAFQGEDFKSNNLGTIFGRYYLSNPSKGNTLKEKLANFFRDYENDSILFQPLEYPYGMGPREQLAASDQKVDGSAVYRSSQLHSSIDEVVLLAERRAEAIIDKLKEAGVLQDSNEFKSAFIGVVKNLKNLDIDEKKNILNIQGFSNKALDTQQFIP